MDVSKVLRLFQLEKSDRAIAGALSINRKTVGKYRTWAAGQGLLAQRALPSREELHRCLAAERLAHLSRDLTGGSFVLRQAVTCACTRAGRAGSAAPQG
jgi:hypothetical protein